MTQEITVLDKRVKLLQPENGFRTSIDSVLLAASSKAGEGETLLDMGCGVGSAGLCALYCEPSLHLTGIDIQTDHIDLATQNAALNGMMERAEFITADMREYKFEKSYHHIICNPPYLETGAHLRSPSDAKATAMGHAGDIALKDWVANAYRLLKPQGSLSMVHEAGSVDRILQAMEGHFGAVEIIPLWPKAARPAKRVIVRAVKGRKSPAIIHQGITLHQSDGGYTIEANKILRDGEGLYL